MRSTNFIVSFSFAFALSTVLSVAHAATFTVDTLGDPGTPSDGSLSLREAIVAANLDAAADVIDLSGISGVITLTDELPPVMHSVVIAASQNDGVIISGNGSTRILEIQAGEVTLSNLTFANGYSCETRGAAVRNFADLTLINCAFLDNRAAVGAGLVNEHEGTVLLTRCHFEGNLSDPTIHQSRFADDLLIYGNAGAAVINRGVLSMMDSTFTDNHAYENAIVVNIGVCIVQRCSFTHNGGKDLIDVPEYTGDWVKLADAPVIRSHAVMGVPVGELYVADCVFENNPVTAIYTDSPVFELHRSAFIRNGNGDGSGAVGTRSDDAIIANCTFFENSGGDEEPDGRAGGAIGIGGGHVKVTNCTIVANSSPVGGGIGTEHLSGWSDSLRLWNSILIGNGMYDLKAPVFAGGNNIIGYPLLVAWAAPGDLLGAKRLQDVIVPTLTRPEGSVPYLALNACGPAVDAGNTQAATSLPQFMGGAHTDQAGQSRVAGAAVDMGAIETTDICQPLPPTGTVDPLPADIASHPALLVNSLADPGVPDDGEVTLREAMAAHSEGLTTDLGQDGAAAEAIDLSLLSGTLHLASGFPYHPRKLTIIGPEDNDLWIETGAAWVVIVFEQDAGDLTISNLGFRGIKAWDGVVRGNLELSITLAGCTFDSCTVRQTNAAVVKGLTVNAAGCSWLDCREGTSIYANRINLDTCRFFENDKGIVLNNTENMGGSTCNNCVFQGNGTTAIFVNSNCVVDSCLFSGNQGVYAGAMESHGKLVTVRNSTFSGNRATGAGVVAEYPIVGGGAILVHNTGGATIDIVHCTVVGNISDYGAGGIEKIDYQWDPAVATVKLRNSIVAGNVSRLGTHDLKGTFGANSGNVIGNVAGAINLGAQNRTGFKLAQVVNPALADNGGTRRTHAVIDCSPALNYPAQILTGTDMRGFPRVSGCKPDAGAFELPVTGCAQYDAGSCPPASSFPNDIVYDGVFTDYTDPLPVWTAQCSPEISEGDHFDGETQEGEEVPEWISLDPCAAMLLANWRYSVEGSDLFPLDEDNDGQLGQMEAMPALEACSLAGAGQLFAHFDHNDDGHISLREAQRRAFTEAHIHSGDTNADLSFDLGELLRIVQLYNVGEYHCAADLEQSEDGYEPGIAQGKATAPFGTCRHHDSDFQPADNLIDLNELLRAIQLYNTGTVATGNCEQDADGFCSPVYWATRTPDMPPVAAVD